MVGDHLASTWHSAISALSTRLFHNVNEKVTPIFGAAHGFEYVTDYFSFRCVIHAKFAVIMSTISLAGRRNIIAQVSQLVYIQMWSCQQRRCCKYAQRLATITLPHLTLPGSHEGSAYSVPWQYSYKPLFTGTMYPVRSKMSISTRLFEITNFQTRFLMALWY